MSIKTVSRGEYHNIDIDMIYFDNLKEYNDSKKTEQFYSLIYIENGKFEIIKDGGRYTLESGDLIFSDEEKNTIKGDGKLRILAFHPKILNSKFTFDYLKLGLRNYKNSDELDTFLLKDFYYKKDNFKILKLNIEQSEKIIDYFEKISRDLCFQDQDYWLCSSRANLMELLYFTQSIKISRCKDKMYGELNIEKVKKYLKLNYSKSITLDMLCREFGTNKMTLTKKFKKSFDETPINYLIKVRVKIAEDLLRKTKLPLMEIMYRVGFSNAGNFYKQFKKYSGLTPNGYRREFTIV